MSRTVLVTGATRGIGRELVIQLTHQGFDVFASGRNQTYLDALKADTYCQGAAADLADPAQTVALYARAQDALGTIDVLINNAGFNHAKEPIGDIEIEDWDQQMAVNLRAPFILCREALRDMGQRGRGHILNVISTAARTSMTNFAVYTASKYGLHGFTQCLIKEARGMGVKVTGVYPGGTDTDFREQNRPDYMQPSSAAAMIVHCIQAPDDVVVHDLTYRPIVESNF